MHEGLFSKRARVPADHPGGRDCHPVNASGLAGNIAADLLETLAPEDLALSRNIRLPFEAVGSRIVSVRLPEYRASNAQPPILGELGKEKLEMIGVERDVSIEVADNLVLQLLYPLQLFSKRLSLGREVHSFPTRRTAPPRRPA